MLNLLDRFAAFIHSINGWTAATAAKMCKHFSIFPSTPFISFHVAHSFCLLSISPSLSHSFVLLPTSLYLVHTSFCASFSFFFFFIQVFLLLHFSSNWTSVLYTQMKMDLFSQYLSIEVCHECDGKIFEKNKHNRKTHFQNEEREKIIASKF